VNIYKEDFISGVFLRIKYGLLNHKFVGKFFLTKDDNSGFLY